MYKRQGGCICGGESGLGGEFRDGSYSLGFALAGGRIGGYGVLLQLDLYW